MESENLRRQQKINGQSVDSSIEIKLEPTGILSSSSSSSLNLMPALKSEPITIESTLNIDDQDSSKKSRINKRSSNRRQFSTRPSTSSSSNNPNTDQQRNKKKLNTCEDSLPSHSDLSNLNKKIQIDEQQFTKNALFHSPNSLLTKLDLKVLFQPIIFESLPRQSQLKLIKLLPECDRQLDSHGSFK